MWETFLTITTAMLLLILGIGIIAVFAGMLILAVIGLVRYLIDKIPWFARLFD